MIWRLEALNAGGLEGTVLGTLVMPYCSGVGNLVFAFVIGAGQGPGKEVILNCLVNNVTNLTLVIGLAAMIWGMNLSAPSRPGRGKKPGAGAQKHELNRLTLLLTLTAALFFTGALWVLGGDGKIDFRDGLVLIGLFLFWQVFHVFEVLKGKVQQKKQLSWMIWINLAVLGVGAYAIYLSTDWLVTWISHLRTGFISARNLGWLSGWLTVLPNALLAFYYARRGNPEVVYTSQVGDGHICIPLCVGITALYHPIKTPAFLQTGMIVLVAAAIFHFAMVALFGRLPRAWGWLLCGAYLLFLWAGFGE